MNYFLSISSKMAFNPLNAELNPICHLLTLLGTHHILHVSRIRVKHPATRRGRAWKEANVAHFKIISITRFKRLRQGCTNIGYQVVVATTFMCGVAPDIGRSSGWTLLSVTFLDHRIFRWLLEPWKMCTPFV